MIRCTTRNARHAIEHEEDFQTGGSLYGVTVDGPRIYMGSGNLPTDWADVFREHAASGQLTYVVYSYATPIAWVHDHQWYRPSVTYSVTTAKHQGQCPATDAVMVLPNNTVLHVEDGWARRVRFEVVKTNVAANEATIMGERRGETLLRTVPLRGLWADR